MKIIYLHQYFCTPDKGGATRSYHIAKAMISSGHQVDMITTHNKNEYMVEKIEGIRVHFLPISYHNHYTSLRRIWSFIQFAFKSYKIAKNISADLVYATSTPLSVGWTALKLNAKKGIPYIFEVRDLWPEAPKALGVIQNKFLLRYLEILERKIYHRADNIIVLSPTMKTFIAKNIDESKICVVPNFSDNSFIPKKKIVPGFELNKKFKITYAGALGLVNDIAFLKKLIVLIDQKFGHSIQFTIMGSGKFAEEIKSLCQKTSNVSFLGFLPKEKVFKELLLSDASLTTFLPFEILESNSPNKFFDGLAMNNISLINFDGWIANLIETHHCGLRIDESNIENQLHDLLQNANEHLSMKQNAKHLALHFFDKDLLCAEIIGLLESNKKKHSKAKMIKTVRTKTA